MTSSILFVGMVQDRLGQLTALPRSDFPPAVFDMSINDLVEQKYLFNSKDEPRACHIHKAGDCSLGRYAEKE